MFKHFLPFGYTLQKCNLAITTADNKKQEVLGKLSLPVACNGLSRIIDFIIIPSIGSRFILGIDFWKKFKIAPDLFTTEHSTLCNSISEIKLIKSKGDLSPSQITSLSNVIREFETISFAKRGLGKTNLIEHMIETEGAPIKQRYYPLSPVRLKQLESEVDKMLELGVIVKSKSPWSNPVLLVPKKDGTARFCLDSRRLNSVTKAQIYPIPNVHRILDNLRHANFITSLDLLKAFWQIPLHPASCEKTSFVVPGKGTFMFVRLPFGLRNAPSELQRLVDTLFGPEFEPNLFAYLDDLIIISKTFEEHIALLQKVCSILKNAGLTLNLEKSEFCKSKLKYLGFVIDKEGLRTDPSKIDTVKNFPRPQNAKQVKSFLGLCSYYRRFIDNFSDIAAPLTNLTGGKKNQSNFTWNDVTEKSFVKLKNALITAPVLSCPDFSRPFIIQCDGSNFAIGACLSQQFEDAEHPVAYYSRVLSKPEKNYSTTERELLAILDAVYNFRSYVEGSKFTVVTDHSSLKWLMSLENPSGRLARWATRLSQFDFNIIHRKGSLHTVPDVLSRIEAPQINSLSVTPDPGNEWYSELYQKCVSNPQNCPNLMIKDNRLYKHCKADFSLLADYEWKLVSPKSDREQLISECHSSYSSIHPGIFKTFKKLSLRNFWLGMYNDVKKYVANCDVCLAYKHSTKPPLGYMSHPKNVDRPMQSLSIDLIGPFPKGHDGNFHILSVVDVFTKYCWLFPLRHATAKAIIEILEYNIFLPISVPRTVIMDNGKQFRAKIFGTFLAKYGVPDVFYNTFYTPMNNVVERYNQTVGTALAIMVGKDHRQWSKHVKTIQAAINNTVSLATGFTPFFLMHGFEQTVHGSSHWRISGDVQTNSQHNTVINYAEKLQELIAIYDLVSDTLASAYNQSAARYNTRHRLASYKIGDIVWRRNFAQSKAGNYFSAKLAPRFVQNRIRERISSTVYLLEDLKGKIIGKFHIKDIIKKGSDI